MARSAMIWVKRAALILPAGAVFGVVAAISAAPWQPMTAPDVAAHVQALHRYGAVSVPHDLVRHSPAVQPLLDRVAQGQALDVAQSARYRVAIQTALAQNQTLFRTLDNNIVFAENLRPDMANNCGTNGIAGLHDWHAQSALSNFAEMDASLQSLGKAGFLGRIRHANRAYKSLTDLMVHLAPAASSVMLADHPPLPIGADLGRAAAYDSFRRAMAMTGFAPINSPEHRAALEGALAAFETLALLVQTAVTAQLSPLEQRIAGRWLAPQSISPRLKVVPELPPQPF